MKSNIIWYLFFDWHRPISIWDWESNHPSTGLSVDTLKVRLAPDCDKASSCFLVIQLQAFLLGAKYSGVSQEFSLGARPACPPQFLAHTYLITPADDKARTTLLLASSYPVLSNVSDPHVSLLPKILFLFLFTSPNSLTGQKHFGTEAARRFRGQYLLALSVSIPGAAAVMKCLSRQVIRTALGKLSLMDAAAKS